MLRNYPVVLAALFGVGCLVQSANPRKPRYAQWAPDRAARSPSDVGELHVLPDGVALINGSIQVAKAFPTEAAPHLVLGVYTLDIDRSGDYHHSPKVEARNQAVRQTAKEQAPALVAAHGGNAYVFAADALWVLSVSDAEPSYPDASDTARRRAPAKATVVSTTNRQLDAWTPLRVNVKKGTCYGVTLALKPDARIARNLLGREVSSIDMSPHKAKGLRQRVGIPITAQAPGVAERAYWASLGCSGESYVGSLTWKPTGQGVEALGTGTVAVSVWSWVPKNIRAQCQACFYNGTFDDKCMARDSLSAGICY